MDRDADTATRLDPTADHPNDHVPTPADDPSVSPPRRSGAVAERDCTDENAVGSTGAVGPLHLSSLQQQAQAQAQLPQLQQSNLQAGKDYGPTGTTGSTDGHPRDVHNARSVLQPVTAQDMLRPETIEGTVVMDGIAPTADDVLSTATSYVSSASSSYADESSSASSYSKSPVNVDAGALPIHPRSSTGNIPSDAPPVAVPLPPIPSAPTSSTMKTIDSIGSIDSTRPDRERANSSDGYTSSDMMNIPPAHPFFAQQSYDSDASDCSFIRRPPSRSSTNIGAASARERFPSHDSQSSLRYVDPSTSGAPKSHPAQNTTDINPLHLPFDQRRKIMQERREQQQLQQQQQQPPLPLTPPPPSPSPSPLVQPLPEGFTQLQASPLPHKVQQQHQQHEQHRGPYHQQSTNSSVPGSHPAGRTSAASPPIAQVQIPAQRDWAPMGDPNSTPPPMMPPYGIPYPPPQFQHGYPYSIPPPFQQPHMGYPPQPFMHPHVPFYSLPPHMHPYGIMPGQPQHSMFSPPRSQQFMKRPSTEKDMMPQHAKYTSSDNIQQRPPTQGAPLPGANSYSTIPTTSQGEELRPAVFPPQAHHGHQLFGQVDQVNASVPDRPTDSTNNARPPMNSNARVRPQQRMTAVHGTQRQFNPSFDAWGTNQRKPPPLPTSAPVPPMSTSRVPSPLHARSNFHVRLDSLGSISTLGSNGAADGHGDSPGSNDQRSRMSSNLGGQHQPPKNAASTQNGSKRSSAGGFFAMLTNRFSSNNVSGKLSSDVPTLPEFHRKNQQFLQKAHQQQQRRQKHAVSASPHSSPMPGQHKRVSSQDRPPASRGTHKRLDSINNDDWEERVNNNIGKSLYAKAAPTMHQNHSEESTSEDADESSDGTYGASQHEDSDGDDSDSKTDDTDVRERTSLLSPPRISLGELDGNDWHQRKQVVRRHHNVAPSARRHSKLKSGSSKQREYGAVDASKRSHRKDRRASDERQVKTKKKRQKARQRYIQSLPSDSESSIGSTDNDYKRWTKKREEILEKKRTRLVKQWKAETLKKAEEARKQREAERLDNRIARYLDSVFTVCLSRAFRCYTMTEAFIANLPLTIGAIAMAIVTLGVVWFKFAEENLDSCEPVHFHSAQCTFPEFPGCFYCDTQAHMYRAALYFHFTCKFIAGFLAMIFILKVLLATKVVLDEMSSPTTASPAGLLCMTLVCVFAGRGAIGQVMVSLAACVHLGLVIWFMYMCLAYHIMPEPSWFPNTIGIGLTAVKTWLYYPMPGHLLMAISLSLNLFFFPISLIRVAVNHKISATVGWMQMSAPAIALYSLTIMAQPSFEEEHPDVTDFQKVHRMIYLPCMHVMCGFSILGFVASVSSLWTRWHDFKNKPFSPAHAAFCFPVLSHANGIQAYRGAVNSFSNVSPGSWRMIVLYVYWCVVLAGGTIATFWITAKFLYLLPKWTNLDLDDEEAPPEPYETIMSLQDIMTAGETLHQPFVSPAVLQANETGTLVLTRSRQDGHQKYVRTRRMPALGFEPTMDWSEMQKERELLLEWVGRNPPKRRHHTLSVPGVDFRYGAAPAFGTDNFGVYGAVSPAHSYNAISLDRRRRAGTASPRNFFAGR